MEGRINTLDKDVGDSTHTHTQSRGTLSQGEWVDRQSWVQIPPPTPI